LQIAPALNERCSRKECLAAIAKVETAAVAVTAVMAAAMIVIVARRRRWWATPDPTINRAAVAIAAYIFINPVNGAPTMIISNAGAFTAMTVIGFGGGGDGENAQTEQGGDKERTKFHSD
jgi:hypothetical protein